MIGALILSHGRPDRVKTVNALKNSGFTGDIRIVCDDLDESLDAYKELYSNSVIVFDKKKKLKECDTMDNFGRTNIVLPARNMCHEIAKSLGWDYFFELDDDYSSFNIRYADGDKLATKNIVHMDDMLDAMIDLLEVSNALCVCMSQSGDLMGGVESKYLKKKLSRKAMNCYVCKTSRPFVFRGTINEDVNMYVTENMIGNIVFSVTNVCCNQEVTQISKGGLTDIYLDIGTYVKSFYSVMAQPSCVTVKGMGVKDRRIHHDISWKHCSPYIISEVYKKQ